MCVFLLMFLLFYLRNPRFIQHFLLLSSHLDSDPGVKKEKKIQAGYSNRDQAILGLPIRQRKCGEVKSKRGKSGGLWKIPPLLSQRMSPAAAWPGTSREKCGPPASLSLLLPNIKLTSTPTQQHGRRSLRDRSHTAGDASAQVTAAPSGQTDEEITHHPGGGVNPCGGDRWDRRREEERRGRPFMEEEEEEKQGSLLSLKKAGLCRPLLVMALLHLNSPHVG